MDEIEELKELIDSSERILVGAGAGLSTSSGFGYTGERLERYFPDFIRKYHIRDMYSGGFYPYRSKNEFWAYWSRYIYINRYGQGPGDGYLNLYRLLKDKNYFVLTTNVDHCFQKAGFLKSRLFYTQGDYGLFQCSRPCHYKTYDNEDLIKKMVLSQGFEIDEDGTLIKTDHVSMEVPSELFPRCPVCGEEMTMNLRADDKFVEDEGWNEAADRYNNFAEEAYNKKTLYLELGVGYNTPVIIKQPFWLMTHGNKKSRYVCINKGEGFAPKEIADRSIVIDGDISEVLKELLD